MEITEIKLFQCFDNFGTSFNDQNFWSTRLWYEFVAFYFCLYPKFIVKFSNDNPFYNITKLSTIYFFVFLYIFIETCGKSDK